VPSDEQLFTVSGATATRGQPLTLAEAGFTERAHLQEWIIGNPEVLGPDVLIVTFEFDRWISGGIADDPRDRLDVLAIDASGTLVIAELKRDRAAVTTELQALKYAAMASRFTTDTLAAAHAAHLSKAEARPVSREEALTALEDHAGGPLDVSMLRRPRVVLVAGDFPQTTTATAVWLSEMGVKVNLVRYQAYRTDVGVVLTASTLWPVADVEEFTIAPQLLEAEQVAQRQHARRSAATAVSRLLDAEALKPGTALRFVTAEAPAGVRADVEEWVEENPLRGRATWTGAGPKALRWEADGQEHTPSGLVRHILQEAAGVDRKVRGTSWWATEDGQDLVTLADQLAPGATAAGRRDWSDLHELLEQVPEGRWTTYGDLADMIGTAPISVGAHFVACDECPGAWRILGHDRQPREGFRWVHSERTDSQRDALEMEGVRFDDRGRADPSQRMRWSGASSSP